MPCCVLYLRLGASQRALLFSKVLTQVVIKAAVTGIVKHNATYPPVLSTLIHTDRVTKDGMDSDVSAYSLTVNRDKPLRHSDLDTEHTKQ